MPNTKTIEHVKDTNRDCYDCKNCNNCSQCDFCFDCDNLTASAYCFKTDKTAKNISLMYENRPLTMDDLPNIAKLDGVTNDVITHIKLVLASAK